MSMQNEIRRTNKINFEFKAKRLRGEIENLAKVICVNLDCGLTKPDDLPIDVVDNQFDELKSKWAELSVINAQIKRLEEELK